MLLHWVRLPPSRICEVIILPKHCSFNRTFFVGQSTALVSVASFSTTTFVTSSVTKLNVGSPSFEISTKSSRAASNLESSSAIINQVFPSASIDVSLPYVTDEAIVSVGTSNAASFTPAALHSAPQWISLSQDTTALTSTVETVEPTIASAVKPTIITSVNGKYIILSEFLQFYQVRLPNVG